MRKRIGVIGSGISGVSAAWLLRETADVSLFEAEQRFGGHTHTYTVEESGQQHQIDTGFMVYNEPNYPILTALFDHLGLASYATNMSFAVSLNQGRLEYAGSNLRSLFAQKSNLLNRSFWGMLNDIIRFNRVADSQLRQQEAGESTLGAFLDHHQFGKAFRNDYLYPMAAAIWSCPRERIADFPAQSFLRFFHNHGLIRLRDRPQWLTLQGGSRSYLERLIADLGAAAHSNKRVVAVRRQERAIELVFADGERQQFDDVVLACHSDQALRLIETPQADERSVLAAIPYQSNRVYLHSDENLMPRRKGVWSSWNYLGCEAVGEAPSVSVTYWMNSLQRIASTRNYFVSLNPSQPPRDELTIAEFHYEHPVYLAGAAAAQQRLAKIQGRDGLWFAGAWTGYGFHEDGIRSGMSIARSLGAEIPWHIAFQASSELARVPRLIEQPA